MSDYNPNIEAAHFRQGGVHEWQAEEGQTDATLIAAIIDAHVEATLAVAYEQRTANLIAWAAGGQPTPELREMIAERLGLA